MKSISGQRSVSARARPSTVGYLDLPEESGLKARKKRLRSIGSRFDPQQKKMESCRDVGTDSNTKLVLKSYILKTDKF